MEESEKRKERLKAIRTEAAEAGDETEAQDSIGEPLVYSLTNPLIESPSVSEAEPRPIFDYYTNPMAAFSQQRNTNPRAMDPGSPAYNAQGNYRRPYQPRGVNATPLGIRRRTSSVCRPPRDSSNTCDNSSGTPSDHFPPNSPHIGDISGDGFLQGGGTGSLDYNAQGNYKRPYQPRGVNATPLGIRRKTSSVYTPSGNSSYTFDNSPSTPSDHFPPNSTQIGDISGDGLPQGDGAGSQYRQGSCYSGSGFRGRAHQRSGRSRGRLKCFYDKSMVEDPWKLLKPVIWKPRDSPKSWLLESIRTKKAKLEEAPPKSTTQQSLAEYLAAAFNEAAGMDTVNDESGT